MTYISQGNIPSKWAHTIQAMKMAEAFAQLVSDFRLVTQAHWTRWMKPRFAFEPWYGIGDPFRIVRLPSRTIAATDLISGFQHPAFDDAAARYARRIGSDLVFTRSPLAAKLSVEAGLPTISEEHAQVTYSEFQWLRAIATHDKFLGVVTIADELKEAYVEAGIPRDKIMVLPSGVDLHRFANAPSQAAARATLGLSPDDAIVAYCGHLYRHKGVDRLIDAARLLPRLTFTIVGGWPADVDRYRSQVADLTNVQLVGFVPNDEVVVRLAAADILVLPNLPDTPDSRVTSPLKLFEYMASARPIVASAIPAIRGVLRHNENAWLVEPGSSAALATGLAYLRDHPDTATRLAATARQDVQQYSWHARAATIVDRVNVSLSRSIGVERR